MLSGTLTLKGNSAPISDAKMRGDQITFTAGGTVYTGRVKGSLMDGTAKSGAASTNWSAARVAQ
jgi:hypothetical protein